MKPNVSIMIGKGKGGKGPPDPESAPEPESMLGGMDEYADSLGDEDDGEDMGYEASPEALAAADNAMAAVQSGDTKAFFDAICTMMEEKDLGGASEEPQEPEFL